MLNLAEAMMAGYTVMLVYEYGSGDCEGVG